METEAVTVDDEIIRFRARLLSAMACSSRLRVLMALVDNGAKVGDLAAQLHLSESATSQHLSRLRESGLVRATRDGQSVYYNVKSPLVGEVLRLLDEHVPPIDNPTR